MDEKSDQKNVEHATQGDDKNEAACSSRVRQPSESLEEKCGKRQRTAASNIDGTDNEKEEEDENVKLVVQLLATSPPKFVQLEEVMNTAKEFTNMALANEIAMNENFKVEKRPLPENSLEKRVSDMMHKAFWSLLQEELKEQPANYQRALQLLTDIKETLFSFVLPKQQKFREEVNEVLDMDLIKQKAQHNALDLQYYGKYVASVMAKTCAPVRDERIKKISQLTDTVEMLKEIMDTLDLMRCDMVNFAIKAIRPGIVDYERQQFKKCLITVYGDEADKLPFTRQWLSKYVEIKRELSPLGYCSKSEILNDAILGLLQGELLDALTPPETVFCSRKGFAEIKNEVERFSVIAAVILVTMSSVGASLRDIADFRKQIKEHVCLLIPSETNEYEKVLRNVSAQVVRDSNERLRMHGFSPLSKQVEKSLSTQIEQAALPTHGIRTLANKRLMEFLRNAITTEGRAARIQVPGGLNALEEELAALANHFRQLVTHNKMVFSEHYDNILTSLLQDQSN